MLPLRLRGTRGIRTRCICSSCCAHVSQGTCAHARGPASTRTYAAGRKKKTAASATVESSENVKTSASPDDSKSGQTSQSEKKNKPKEGSKPTVQPKKNGLSAGKAKAVPASPGSIETDETMKLWKETLDVLKNLKEAQEISPEAIATDKTSKNGEPNAKRSLKSQFPPIQAAPSKVSRRQAKLLEGTLDVLKSVLTIQAEQKTKAGREGGSLQNADHTKAHELMQHTSMNANEDGKNEPINPSKDPEKSGQQGFAALVAGARAKKSFNTVRASRVKSEAKKTSSPKITGKTEDKNSVENVGWGNTKGPRDIKKIKTAGLALMPVDADTAPVPSVQYGLDRVLFNEGVYVLQDPRTRVYNFDPYLATIMPVDEFDFDALKQYVTSSKDLTLIGIAKQHKKKYTGSTSSMTATLAHFHYLLSSWRRINPERISKGFIPDSETFGAVLRAPAATFLHYKDGTYAIDADKEYDSDTILSMLGKSMEKLLTAPREEFEKYSRANSHKLTEDERNADESYHYTTFGDFMMRSQLDAYDPRLPGTGVFDLKTRAVVSIRMDARNHKNGAGYEIRQRQGQWESFEREYYDMIRLAFLKYSLQVRMGRMDGIFVAYHNTQRIFGFQYIPLEEMDLSLHGTTDLTIGNREFMASLQLLQELYKKATERFPERSLRIHVETRTSSVVPFLYFFAEPVTDEEIKAIQEQNKEEAARFQETVLGIKPKPDGGAEAEAEAEAAREELEEAEEDAASDVDAVEEDAAGEVDAVEEESAAKVEHVDEAKGVQEAAQEIDEEDSEDVWEAMMEVVEETMESDAQGIPVIRDAIEEALKQSGLLEAKSSEEVEQYVEALVKAIVDVDPEKPKNDDEGAAQGSEVESETFGEQQRDQEVGSAQQNGDVDSGGVSSQAEKTSRFSFLSSWFGSTSEKTTTKEEPATETEQTQSNDSSIEQDSISEAPATESKGSDDKPDDSLKDLIIKLTSRVGSSSDAAKATQELSEDQAKLRNFESILMEMMPKAEGSPAEPTETAEDAASSDADETMENPASGGRDANSKPPVLGMVLTVRNKVNNEYVQRPINLTFRDKWNVEYTMEEIPEDKVRSVYMAIKGRRRAAFYKEPGKDYFKMAFKGMLKHYSREGKKFRAKETELAKRLPIRVVRDVPVCAAATPDEQPPTGLLQETVGFQDTAEETVEMTEADAVSFREWRAKNQQNQEKEKEEGGEKKEGEKEKAS